MIQTHSLSYIKQKNFYRETTENQKIHFLGLLLLIILSVTLTGCELQDKKTVTVIFRYDDYSALSPTDIETKIIDNFRKNNLSLTFGVIPFEVADNQLDPSPQALVQLPIDKCEILKAASDAGILDVALHGYSHQTHNSKDDSEFLGVDYQTQITILEKGKSFVENVIGKPVETFIPPWNTYDKNTIKALETLGFKTISADRNQVLVNDSYLNFLPATSSLAQLKQAIQLARISIEPHPIIVVIFHSYDFRPLGKEPGFPEEKFPQLISWISSQKDIKVLSISQAILVFDDLGIERFALSKLFSPVNRFLPSFLQDNKLLPMYSEYNITFFTYFKIILFYFLILAIGILTCYSLSLHILSKYLRIQKVVIFGSLIITSVFIFVIFRDQKVFLQGAVLLVSSISASLGFLLFYFGIERRKFRKPN